MTVHNIPVSPLPRGMEWAVGNGFLYGVDKSGNVHRLGSAAPKGRPRLRDRIRERLRR